MNKIGIIGAMELEVTTLRSLMEIENTVKKASLTFYEGRLEGKLEEKQELMRKLSNKFSIEQIAEMLEIDISEVENIIKELAK